MTQPVLLTIFSDVLCVWACIAQARVDEVRRQFADAVAIDFRFCSVFGDTRHKIGSAWAARGGFEGFGAHVREAAEPFEHVRVHPDLWELVRPPSSAPAHLVLKAVQRVDPRKCEAVLRGLRVAFFEHCRDIAQWSVLQSCLESVDVPPDEVRIVIDSGVAHADLEADYRERDAYRVQGSPTIILNEGRQTLYGNVGYSVIAANINELLRSPTARPVGARCRVSSDLQARPGTNSRRCRCDRAGGSWRCRSVRDSGYTMGLAIPLEN